MLRQIAIGLVLALLLALPASAIRQILIAAATVMSRSSVIFPRDIAGS